MITNIAGDHSWDKKSRLGYVEINGQRFQLFLQRYSWSDKRFCWIYHYAIRVSNDWNQSNKFTISARTIPALKRKIERHEARLIR